ncbi:hypothetical protein BP6252_06262 [Coleophoma cylindrospora]|uniref:C2H2-type domain-containing protein n=1 Tax=Coleophoma cylindrospora TaxID=1849047 RepID=A0A3D8RME7_9HELO|nr:hypothetical protein BP6252_06262 [Coleophoma cylindrospora]
MLSAQPPRRPSSYTPIQNPYWPQSSSLSNTTPQSYDNLSNNLYSFGADQNSLISFQPQQSSSNLRIQVQQPELMQSEHNNSWLSNGQLTPKSATTRAHHHRESSLSSLGSAGPASPYNQPTASNPHIALSTDPVDIYYDLHDPSQYHSNSKPLTPAHTPSQEQFLTSQYSRFNPQSYPDFSNNADFSQLAAMNGDGGSRSHQAMGDAELMPAPDFGHSGRPSVVSVASNDSPSTPPTFNEDRRKHGETISSNIDFWLDEYLQYCVPSDYRSTMPKLDRTMTDIYQDELYNPNFQITSAPPARSGQSTVSPAQNDIFNQRLRAANSQHLSSMAQTPMNVPSRERSPFRQGSPLAPAANKFGVQNLQNMRLGTASGLREQQKAENDAMALRQQMERQSPARTPPKTISPKDVDLIYHESDEDANMPLFPKQEQQSPQQYHPQVQQSRLQEPEMDDTSSQQSFGSMATSRRESSGAYSTSSQNTTPHASNFNFGAPLMAGSIRTMPQQYPFVPQARSQTSNVSSTENFPSTLTSMESSSSEYAPESSEIQRPARTSADGGTYTCTYHNCTLRFDTPAKLQKHKREGHRQTATLIGGSTESTEDQANSQAGPHKCERINPSTGKPCNTIFSRPYDLTRHEDTIHNARKQKIRCNLCTEEKTFSRADALTRHYRVVHPQEELPGARRRRVGA